MLLPGSTDADLDETVLIVPHAGGPGPAGQLLHGQAPTVVEEPDRAGAVPRDHHDLVAPTVPAHPLLGAMGVHHTDQAAAAVMDPGVGAPTVLVRHHGDHAGQVGVGRDPAGGRTLCGDPAGVVVGVVHLHHAVTIHHPADQPVLVPLVAAPRARPGDLDQLPLAVVGEGQAAPVRGLRRGDPPGVLVPDQLDAAATLVDQADQAPVAVLVVHRGPRAAGLTQEHAGGAERPAAAGVVRGHQGLAGGTAAPLQPQALAHGTVPALPHAGEDRDPTVRVHPTGAVLIQVQARVRRTGPPRPEPTGLAGGGVVHADQCQRGAASGEGQVHLRLDEVPGGGVDRVVGVAVGEGTSLDGRQVDGDLGTLRDHTGRVQGRLDGGVREGGDTAGTARSLEGAGHGVRPGGVLVIVGQVGVIGGEHAGRVHRPPCAGGLERGVARPQRGGLVAQLVVLGPAGGREGPQVSRVRRRRPTARAGGSRRAGLRSLARSRVRYWHALIQGGCGWPDGRRVLTEDGVPGLLRPTTGVMVALPRPCRLTALLLLTSLLGEGVHLGGHVTQRGSEVGGIGDLNSGVSGEEVREVSLEVLLRRGHRRGAGRGLPVDEGGAGAAGRGQGVGVVGVVGDVLVHTLERADLI